MNEDAENAINAILRESCTVEECLYKAMRWAYADAARICRSAPEQYDDFHGTDCNEYFAKAIEERATAQTPPSTDAAPPASSTPPQSPSERG